MTQGITYVNVGERDLSKLFKSISIVRSFSQEIPIRVYSDINLDLKFTENIELIKFNRVKYSVREENRNSSLFRLISLKESDWDNTCYLDSDIFIVNNQFLNGFKIAENYGITMVENPRYFIKTNLELHQAYQENLGDLDIGADVNEYDREFTKDMPNFMMALNMGVIFYNHKSKDFLNELIREQESNPSRGQAGLYRTIWKTKKFPYSLPVQWLVCKKHLRIQNPLALHVGHKEILDWYNIDFKK